MENRLFVVGVDGQVPEGQATSVDLTQIEQQLASINSALWALVAVMAPQAQAREAASYATQASAPVAGDWRSAVPPELYERLRARRVEPAPASAPAVAAPIFGAAAEQSAAAAHSAALPAGYRAPYLPGEERTSSGQGSRAAEPAPLAIDQPRAATPPPAFKGLDWRNNDRPGRLLVSVKPVPDAALAERVAGLLATAPGFSGVRPLGATGDVSAYEVQYDGDVPRGTAVSRALKDLGASLVAGGDREFYLAIEGQLVR